MRGRCSGAMPVPVSPMRTRTTLSSMRLVSSVSVPPFFIALRAFWMIWMNDS